VRVLLAGGSGVIGTALSRSLISDGHVVRLLVRREPRQNSEVQWHPERGELDRSALNGVDAVVCLSGAGVGDHRWSDEYKRVLVESRHQAVGTLAQLLTSDSGAVRVFVSASAVGYYGDAGDQVLDETVGAGSDFLAQLCVQWEAAAAPVADAGIRAAQLRTGLVLSPQGGLLARLRPIVKAGIGGRLGTGRQFCPWISLTDEVAAIRFILDHAPLSGPVNLTAPSPVRNSELVATLADLLRRPAVLPVPGFALRIVLGEFAADVLGGQRAVPSKLTEAGFTFRHETLVAGLRSALDTA
jgi:uncharacterized protein (TIGR01777 family)